MSNLTKTAQTTRTTINVIAILIVTLVFGRIVWGMGVSLYKQLIPEKEIPPTVGYGPLPYPIFPAEQPEVQLRLETIGNAIPSFGEKAKVFLVLPSGRSSFLDLDRAKRQAAALGFLFDPQLIQSTRYRWLRTNPLQASLNMDVVTDEFTMKVQWETDPQILTSGFIPTETQAISEAKSYLKGGQFLASDLENGRAVITYLEYVDGQYVGTLGSADADFVQVDLFRESFTLSDVIPISPEQGQAEVRIIPADPKKGLARVILSGSREQGKRIISAEYKYHVIDYQQFETYPIISGPEAWERLLNGFGHIARPPETGNLAVIRRVSLGYYDPLDGQQFLQPVYVFEGDQNFMALVPAIATEYLQTSTGTTAQ